MAEEKLSSIEEAIASCTVLAGEHNSSARNLLSLAFTALGIFLSLGVAYFILHMSNTPDKPISGIFVYLLFGSFIAVFGVLMSTYRFHLGEASRINYAKVGFMRIRVAAHNSKDTFQSEVRKALTENAFSFPDSSKSSIFSRGKKLENPMPGHPALDLSTELLNKIIEQVEVSIKPK